MTRKTSESVPAPSASEQQIQAEASTAETGSTDVQRAAEKRAAALKATSPTADPRTQNEINGLLIERRGYVQRGLDDRVAQVDEQITLRGGTPPRD